MKLFPDIITVLRMALSAVLLLCDVTGTAFWAVYLVCGISDMTDGWLARRLHCATKTGAMLDSVADICFVACCGWQLVPVLTLPLWLWLWAAAIAIIKVANQIAALMTIGKCSFPHTIANKVTGLLLFITIPTTFLSVIPITFVAAVATFAAIHEGHIIRTKTM